MSVPSPVCRGATAAAAYLVIATLAACTGTKPVTTATVATEVPLEMAGDLEPGEFRSGRWLGLSDAETGTFRLCAVTAVYDSGRRLSFSLDRNGAFGFYLGGRGWTLTRRERHPIAYSVDDYIYFGTATAILSDTLQVDIDDPPLMFDRFKAASVISTETLGGRFRFSVPGIAAAFDALQACVASHGGIGVARAPAPRESGINPFLPPRAAPPESPPAGSGSNPFAPRTSPRNADPNSPEAHVAAHRFVERLLTEAGLTEYRFLTGAEVPDGKRHAAVVWQIGEQVGTLLIVEARRYPSVVEASASIVKDASRICDEGFTSSIAARRLRDDRPAAQIVVSCARPTRFHATYTVVPVADVGYYRLTLSTSDDPGEIDATHERIGAALARVVPEE